MKRDESSKLERDRVQQAGIEALADAMKEKSSPRKRSETGAYKSLLDSIKEMSED